MIDTITYNKQTYPKFQQEGFAAKFAFPFAEQVCKGYGVDIGYCKPEWMLPTDGTKVVIGVDQCRICSHDGVKHEEVTMPMFSALNLPSRSIRERRYDFIFSSHCLEHLPNYVDALEHWYEMLINGGTIFLYLPDFSQHYWRPWNNRKHIHAFTPDLLKEYFIQKGYKNIFVSGVDLNNSFMIMAEK